MTKTLLALFVALAFPILCSFSNVEVSLIELTSCSQSSTYEGAQCGRATDGNPDGAYSGSSCSCTNSERGWWKARAAQLTYFREVRIYNRQDCCPDRLNDFSIKIDGQECARYQSSQPFTDKSFPCNRVGHVIQIESHKVTHLTLCEVQAFGHTMSAKQLKLHSCSQSSTSHGGVCSRAIDGNKDQNYFHNSCSCSGYGVNQWWQAQTERTALISQVRIYNRMDCCPERLNDITILVGDRECASFKSSSTFSERTFECNTEGQVIRIRNNLQNYLTMCEVEVFGVYPSR